MPGYLYVTGRASTLIVTEGGKNVQPEEVEGSYETHPAIGQIGVLQKDRRLVAVVVPDLGEVRKREDGDVEKAVREAVEEGSKRVPSYQRFSNLPVPGRTRRNTERSTGLRNSMGQSKKINDRLTTC